MLLLHAMAAYGYETDQLTRRAEPLADVRETANAEVNAQLAAAIVATNQALGCRASTNRTRRHLATEIHARLARSTVVEDRGMVEGLGYGAYSAFLETAPLERREFLDHSDIYGELKATDSAVLGTAGVCSTIRLAGVLMGTDKLDHFFGQGLDYLQESRWGRAPHRAIVWGTATELSAYGLLTSNVFSFADLHANRRGYEFYSELLTRRSAIRRDSDGCVVSVRAFDWADWVDDGYDEVLNPSTYGREVGAAVAHRLAQERETVCAGYEKWGADVEQRRARLIPRVSGDAGSKAPPRPDGTEFVRLCGLEPPKVNVPFEVVAAPLPDPGSAADPEP